MITSFDIVYKSLFTMINIPQYNFELDYDYFFPHLLQVIIYYDKLCDTVQSDSITAHVSLNHERTYTE